MKKILLPVLFVFLFSNLSISQGCLPDGLILETQTQVDNFPSDWPGCSIIEGDLIVEGGNIVNLDSLFSITIIEGDLQINSCYELQSVSGLSNIESVYGIRFYQTKRLKVIDCFSKITTLSGSLILMINDSINDVSSFQNIAFVGDGFRVSGTKMLKDLSAFGSLETIITSFTVSSNDLIQEVSGFSGTDSLLYTYIGSNKSLKSISGFQNLKNTGRQFHIVGNDSLFEINLPSIKHAEYFSIESNNSLEVINLPNLFTVEGLRILNNDNLVNIHGIPNLDSVRFITLESNIRLKDISGLGGSGLRKLNSLTIRYNDSLQSLSGFNSLKKMDNLDIMDGCMITEINAFHNLDSISGDLILYKLRDLKDMDVFEKLKYIGGEFEMSLATCLKSCPDFSSLNYIEGNLTLLSLDSIRDLSGFVSLNGVGGDITIKSNNRLLSLSGFNHLERVVGDFNILSNIGLVSLQGFDSLKTVSGSLKIERSKNMKDIGGFESLNHTGGISLSRLKKLETIHGFTQLNTMDGFLFLMDLDKLKDLYGFKDVKKINRSLSISGCHGLKDLKGLENLKLISGTLSIFNCDSLENLQGLNNVSKIGGALYIVNNAQINSLQGINNAELNFVEIRYNPFLSMCSVESVCQLVDSKYIIIENNATGCNTVEEINEMCYELEYYSDDVFSMINEQPKWNVLELKTEIPYMASTLSYNYTNDFVLCGNRYSKINFEDINKRAYIRSNHEKAYYRNTEDCARKEYLLYDYTLNVGDTTYVGWNQYDWILKDTAAFVVKLVEEVEHFGRARKRLTLAYAEEDAAYTGQLHWLEGIGCEEHPFYPFAKMDDYLLHEYELLCFDSLGHQLYQSPNWNVCDTNFTSIGDIQKSVFNVSPNPFTNQLKITSEREEIQEIYLLSLTGQLIPISWDINSGNASVHISAKHPNGIYILRIITANGYRNIKLVMSGNSMK